MLVIDRRLNLGEVEWTKSILLIFLLNVFLFLQTLFKNEET